MPFANIDGETWTLILGAVTTIGGALYKGCSMIWRFAATKGNEVIAYAKPKVDEFLEKHNSLVDTLRETQTKGTEAIGEIRKDLHCVKEQVEQNSGVLEQIRENTCPAPQRAVGTGVSNA